MAVLSAPPAATETAGSGATKAHDWDSILAPGDVTRFVLGSYQRSTTLPSWTDTDLLQEVGSRAGPRVTSAQCYATDPRYATLASWFVGAALLSSATAVPQQLSASEALDRLRAWTGLSTTGIAELLGVARRSLYHWTSAGVRPRQEGRLLNLVEAIEPYSKRAEPWQLKDALTSPDARDAVADGDRAAIRLAIEQTIERRPQRMRRVVGDTPAEPAAIGMAELREYLSSVNTAARQVRVAPSIPRELSDSEYPPEA